MRDCNFSRYIFIFILIVVGLLPGCGKTRVDPEITNENAVEEVFVLAQKLKDDPTKSSKVLAGLRIISADLAKQKELLSKLGADNTSTLVDLLAESRADAHTAESLELVLAWENGPQQITKNTWEILHGPRPKTEIRKNYCRMAAQAILVIPARLDNFDTETAACILSAIPEDKSAGVIISLSDDKAQNLRDWAVLNAHLGKAHPAFKRLYKFSIGDDTKKEMRNQAFKNAYKKKSNMVLFAKDLDLLGLGEGLHKDLYKLDDFEGSLLWSLAKKIQKDTKVGVAGALSKEDIEDISYYIKKKAGDKYNNSVENTKFGPNSESVFSVLISMGADKTQTKIILNIDDFDINELLAEMTRLAKLDPAVDEAQQKNLNKIFKIVAKNSQDAVDISNNNADFLNNLVILKATATTSDILTKFLGLFDTSQKREDATAKIVNNKNALQILADNARKNDAKYTGEDASKRDSMIQELVHVGDIKNIKNINNHEDYKNILVVVEALGSADDLAKVFAGHDNMTPAVHDALIKYILENSAKADTASAFKTFYMTLKPADARQIRSDIIRANNKLDPAEKKRNFLSFISDNKWGLNADLVSDLYDLPPWAGTLLGALANQAIVDIQAALLVNDMAALNKALDDLRQYAVATRAKIANDSFYNKLVTELTPGATDIIRDALKAILPPSQQDSVNFYLGLDD